MAACTKLRVVGRHGAGLDIVDIPAATRLGVAVVHAPGSNSQAVAEHALMLMLMCVKRAVEVDKGTRAGNWFARDDAANTELGGKTLGIVGIGNVGRRVAKFTGALGMRVLAYDKYVPDDEVRRRGAEPVASLEALLPQVDVLTCHTPLTSETRAMINEKTLGLMKRGAIFVNTSRGPVQDERALFKALATGQLGAAGIDVFEEEPTPARQPHPQPPQRDRVAARGGRHARGEPPDRRAGGGRDAARPARRAARRARQPRRGRPPRPALASTGPRSPRQWLRRIAPASRWSAGGSARRTCT